MLTKKKLSLALAISSAFIITGANASQVDEAIKIEKSIIKNAANTQKKIDRYSDKTADLLSDYKTTLNQVSSLKAYNRVMEEQVKSQEELKASIQGDIDSIDETEKGVIPLMEQMIDTLDRFVQEDVPFLIEERTKRVQDLKDNMLRADISNSVRYQRILEAYQIENDYGASMNAYQGKDDQGREVDFLYIGRVVLVYQTRDGKEAYRWNNDSRSWEQVSSDEYRVSIKDAMKVARGTANPQLVKVPVDTAEMAQ